MAGCNPKPETVIADDPPNDGREWDCQCARCGSSCYSASCEQCGGDGVDDWGDYNEFDDEGGPETCDICSGDGGWMVCLSSESWCQANPRPGREAVQRGAIEWFTFESAGIAPSAAPSQQEKS